MIGSLALFPAALALTLTLDAEGDQQEDTKDGETGDPDEHVHERHAQLEGAIRVRFVETRRTVAHVITPESCTDARVQFRAPENKAIVKGQIE